MLVGYYEYNTRCYRVYDPVAKVVRRTIHVTFNEASFPGKANEQPSIVVPEKVRQQPVKENPKVSSEQLPPGSRSHEDAGIPINDDDSAIQDLDKSRDLISVGVRPRIKTGFPKCTLQDINNANLGVHYAYIAAEDLSGNPRSYQEAMKSRDADKWHAAT